MPDQATVNDALLEAIDARLAELAAHNRNLAHVDIGFRPHRFQQQIYARRKRFTVVCAHRRFGKTVCAIALLVTEALRCERPSPRYAYCSPFLKQSRTVAWDYLKNFVSKIPGAEIREGDLSVNLPNGARIALFGADNAEGILGIYLDGIVLDEVANFKPDVWSRIIRPTLTDRKGWALFISTPRGQDVFYELFHACDRPENRVEWISMMFPADETGLIADEELESNRRIQSPAIFR
jgi:phage terminase large subunit